MRELGQNLTARNGGLDSKPDLAAELQGILTTIVSSPPCTMGKKLFLLSYSICLRILFFKTREGFSLNLCNKRHTVST
jgi:hypothetical protein